MTLVAGVGTTVAPLAASAGPPIATSTAGCPWVSSGASIPSRVAQLLGAMSLSQRIGMVNLNVGPGYENVTPAIPGLCLPAMTLQDGPGGVTAGVGAGPNGSGTATQLPAPVDLAASFDPSLARAYGTVLGSESLAKGIDAIQAPDVNIARVPQAGRNFEVFGEDPYLAAQTAVGEINGIQSSGTMAVIKHFAAYNQETNRGTQFGDDSILAERTLQEIYLPAFQAAVQEARVASVMCSYNMVNGDNACQNATLIKDTLETQWGFAGFVRSDLAAVWDQSAAFAAGLDQFKPSAATAIQAGVTNGTIPVSSINGAVSRILTEMFRFGLFTRTLTGNASTPASTPAHQAVATRVAEEGSVLLQNNGPALPLPRTSGTTIQVLGSDSGSGVETGPTPGSSASVEPTSVVTPCQGLTAAAAAATVRCDSTWAPSSAADATAQAIKAGQEAASAHEAVVFVDVPAGEGADLSSLDLPNYQDTLIDAVAKAQPNTVVVVHSGNPVVMPWLSNVRSVVEDWYGGQTDGTAIAALLYGDANFSGKLPMTFPTSTAATPTASAVQFPGINGQVQYTEGTNIGYRGYQADGITPEFPFGYGLSYTSFSFSPVSLSSTAVTNDTFAPNARAGSSPNLLTASTTVKNTGAVAGSEVAQLYVADPASTGEQRQLVGYQRVTLAPGASQTVSFPLDARALSYFNATSGGWVAADGAYTVYAGDSSALAGLPQQASFSMVRSVGARFSRLSMPTVAAAGTTIRASSYFVNQGDDTIYKPHFSVQVPAGWKVTTTWKPVNAIPPHSRVRRIFSITAPVRAQGTAPSFTAQLRYAVNPRVYAVKTLVTSPVTVTFGQVVTTTTTPLVIDPGASHPTKVSFANPSTTPVRVYWTARTGPGVTITPSSGTALVFHRGRAIYLNIRTSTATTPGYAPINIAVKGTVTRHYTRHVKVIVRSGHPSRAHVTYRVQRYTELQRYYLPGATIGLTMAYSSLGAAYNDVGVTAGDPSAGNYDGYGNTYAATSLAAADITPGSTVSAAGFSFTWPTAGPAVPDEVLVGGQTVSMSGSGTALGLLGSGTGGDALGTVTVRYTDGTTSQTGMRLTNWTSPRADGPNTLVTTTSAENRSDSAPPSPVSLFVATIPLAAGKQVAQVILPTTSPNRTMHVFATAIR